MKKRNKQFKKMDLLPFDIIKAASEGNVIVINSVLKHYEGYIVSLSSRIMYDKNGNPYYGVDETLRRRLETKLITSILKFKPVPRGSKKEICE